MIAGPLDDIPSVTILGCRVDALDMEQTLARIQQFIAQGGAHQVVTLGTEMVVHARRDPAYREIVNRCALSVCDTVGLLWASRLRRGPLRGRVAGVELVERLCAVSAQHGITLFFLGGAPGVAARAAEQLASRYPGVRIVGTRDGYFSGDADGEVCAQIRQSGADVVFAGLGFPKQEVWLARNLEATGAKVGIGVGGSFDVLSGYKQRAPQLWRRLHLEWMYRLITEPSRWRRQLALPLFAGLALREQFGSVIPSLSRDSDRRGPSTGSG